MYMKWFSMTICLHKNKSAPTKALTGYPTSFFHLSIFNTCAVVLFPIFLIGKPLQLGTLPFVHCGRWVRGSSRPPPDHRRPSLLYLRACVHICYAWIFTVSDTHLHESLIFSIFSQICPGVFKIFNSGARSFFFVFHWLGKCWYVLCSLHNALRHVTWKLLKCFRSIYVIRW